jgi:transposase InsO family protein
MPALKKYPPELKERAVRLVLDAREVGWQLSTSLHTDLALDALEMGIWTRQRAGRDLTNLIHHSDRGVQGGFNRSWQHPDLEVTRGTTRGLDQDEDGTAWDEVSGQAAD